tara:strand:- start:1765 stop:2217 length:453 start_codon:yes stop_codon:yes gene_type:complete
MKYFKGQNRIEYDISTGITSSYQIKKHNISDAALAIGVASTECLYSWDGVDYEGLNWLATDVDKPTESEINAKIAELDKDDALKLLRIERNEKLSNSDWVVTKSNETGVGIATDWKTYRQSLRDLPSTSNPTLTNDSYLDYSSFTWPTEP